MSGRAALVAGGTGFVGSAVAAALRARGYDVVAAGREDADLEDPAAAARLVRSVAPDVIVQAAGGARDAGPEKLWSVLAGSTANLLDAAAALPRRPRVVVVGSAAEYGDAFGAKPAREDGPARPAGAYGSAKLAQTLTATSYRHQGLDVAVARVFNSCGPGSPRALVPGGFIAQLVSIERGAAPVLRAGDLSGARDFVDIRDIAAAVADLCAPRVPAGVYNVCSGRATTIREVLAALLALSSARVEVAARAGSGGIKVSVGDNRKLRRATGWKPRFTLERSLRDALAAARLSQ